MRLPSQSIGWRAAVSDSLQSRLTSVRSFHLCPDAAEIVVIYQLTMDALRNTRARYNLCPTTTVDVAVSDEVVVAYLRGNMQAAASLKFALERARC